MSDLIKRLSERAPNAETGDDSCLMELACEALEANAALIALLRASLRKVEDEVEGLRRDAERYRWLRDPQVSWGVMFAEPIRWDGGAWGKLGSRWIREHLDKAIDADIEQAAKEPK